MSPSAKKTIKLVKGCMANERSAQEGLYKQFYTDMLRLCIRYLKTNDLAKEALNQGFLKVFQNINSFDDKKGELNAWVATIMIRTCIDIKRKELKFTTDIDEAGITENVFVSPAILDKLYAEDLIGMIRFLPDATQMVFNLSVIDGYSHKEISEQLNITESTSRWHLSEGKKQLRVLLEPRGAGHDYPTEHKKGAR
ncbi:RNA polymerase sigma factor [Pedobacter foliorum]|uniref:RNA polymerase sigma factor n=1 Tax=Pedobacter foliorum TaxID=2739058 RepID=UPI001567A91A|nr:RNA polymerase sigma factor [Pedobacter foliorum]NRF38751.1 RNA polymerase sigma factor [Pedobacter foliorum]